MSSKSFVYGGDADYVQIRRFKKALFKSGYLTAITALMPVFPWLRNPSPLDQIIDPQLQSAVNLLYRGYRVERSNLFYDLNEALQYFIDIGIVKDIGDGSISLGRMMLTVSSGILMFNERPSASMMLYFGPESYGLGQRLFIQKDDDVLDVCAGPGFQSLVAARNARHVTAVEVNPIAAGLLRLNATLNECANINVICSSFENYEPECEFDLVVFNPPLLPVPTDLTYSLPGNGGVDGLEITRSILQHCKRWLSPNGRFQFVGHNYMSSERGELLEDLTEVTDNNFFVELSIVSKTSSKRGSPAFENLVKSCLLYNQNKTYEEVACMIEEYAARMGNPDIISYAACGYRSDEGGSRIVDYSKHDVGLWFV